MTTVSLNPVRVSSLLRRWIVLAALLAARALAANQPSPTMVNLQLAFDADVNAEARYLAFSERAEREGYRQVAKLFRAAARSERIRAQSHADTLRRLGGEPRSDVKLPAVNGTRANLLWTLAHENAERIALYPRFAQQARKDGNTEAVLGFTLAHAAEGELVKLYQDALGRLDTMREPGEDLYVCTTCGLVARKHPPEQCPVSLSQRDAFVRID